MNIDLQIIRRVNSGMIELLFYPDCIKLLADMAKTG